MKTQEDLEKAWAKMEMNSCYGNPPVPKILMSYDKLKAFQITEQSKKILTEIQKIINLK